MTQILFGFNACYDLVQEWLSLGSKIAKLSVKIKIHSTNILFTYYSASFITLVCIIKHFNY